LGAASAARAPDRAGVAAATAATSGASIAARDTATAGAAPDVDQLFLNHEAPGTTPGQVGEQEKYQPEMPTRARSSEAAGQIYRHPGRLALAAHPGKPRRSVHETMPPRARKLAKTCRAIEPGAE